MLIDENDSHPFQYTAGVFDAEGTLSLVPNGAFIIGIEISNEKIPKLFQEKFGGKIYERQRKDRKKTWTWRINSINEQAIFFLKALIPYSIIKKSQMQRLLDYLLLKREDRRNSRANAVSTIKSLKSPLPLKIKQAYPRNIKEFPSLNFEMWLAGVFDGDGNIVCNIYKDKRNNKSYFGHQISMASIYLDSLIPINDHFEGTFTTLNRSKNTVFKWTCRRYEEQRFCHSIYPFLRIKKEQCKLFQKFISSENLHEKYEIINQIKHLNSL